MSEEKKMIVVALTEDTIKILKEHPEFTEKWIKGLGSGKYTQVEGRMCDPNVPNSACCLHVMEMECNGKGWEQGFRIDEYLNKIEMDTPKMMDSPIRIRYLEGEECPENILVARADGCYYRPYEWNDDLKLTFHEIADLLEFGEIKVEDRR